MDEASTCWFFWMLVCIWRQLMTTSWLRQHMDKVERWLLERMDLRRLLHRGGVVHHFALGTPFFEWWFFALLGLSILALRGFWDVVMYDYVGFHFLLSTRSYDYQAAIDRNFARGNFPNGQATNFRNEVITVEELRRQLEIPMWLRGLAMAAPLVGAIAFVIFMVHIVSFVNACKEERAAEVEQQNQRNSVGQDGELHMVGARVHVRGRTQPGTIVMVDPRDTDGIPYKIRFDPEIPRKTGIARMVEACQDAVKSLSGAPTAASIAEKEDWFSYSDVEGIHEDINPWVADVHEDLALLVVMMPAVFIVMAMKAEIRVIQIMTASTLKEGQEWDTYELPLFGTYTTDLELSAMMQYVTVFAFAMLCTRFFNLSQLEKLIVNRENHFYMKVNELAKHKDDASRQALLAPDGKTKEELVLELRKKSEQHHVTLSLAGLLGVWGYIVVGLVRCLFGIVVAVFLENTFKQDGAETIRKIQEKVLATVQPVFLFSMGLCIVNMIVVLRIEDLKNPAAFGVNANLKFVACRGLLIVADGQANALTFLAKNSSFTQYQAKLTHVCLLMIECFAVVLFNSIMWKQTVRMRSVEAREVVTRVVREVQNFVPPLRVLATSEPFLGSIVAPLVFLVFVLALATAGGGGPVEHVPKQSAIIVLFDTIFQTFGPLLACGVLAVRKLWRDPSTQVLGPSHNSAFAWLPRGWLAATVVVWLAISAGRWVFFMLTHPFHYHFSDHIFLVMSVVAMLQMELAVGHITWMSNRKDHAGAVVIVCTWVLLILIYWDAWNTAMYYHTPQAVWTAFLVGLVFFGIAAVWWLKLLAGAALGSSSGTAKYGGAVNDAAGRPLLAGSN